jgi:hypothetical protein
MAAAENWTEFAVVVMVQVKIRPTHDRKKVINHELFQVNLPDRGE